MDCGLMTPPKGERTSGTWPHGTTWILFRCTPWSLLKYHDKRPFSWQRVVDVSMTPLKVEIPTYLLMLSSDRSVGIMAMIQHRILCLSFRRCLVLQWCLSYLLKDAYNRSCRQMGWWLLTYLQPAMLLCCLLRPAPSVLSRLKPSLILQLFSSSNP